MAGVVAAGKVRVGGSAARTLGTATARAGGSSGGGGTTGGEPFPTTYTIPSYAELAFSDVDNNNHSTNPGGTRTLNTSASWVTHEEDTTWLVDAPGCYYGGSNFRIDWANKGGDWFDLNGTAQGPTPYATGTVAYGTLGPFTISGAGLTALVNSWCSGALPNYGFMVMSNQTLRSCNCYSRFNATAANRPKMTINGVDVACGRSVPLAVNQVNKSGLGNVDNLNITNPATNRVLLWFDLTAFSGVTITSATITMTVFQTWGGGPTPVNVFRLWNPGHQANIPAQTLGLAKDYPQDVGIENHASVWFTQKFEDEAFNNKWMVSTAAPRITTPEVANGMTAFPPGAVGVLKCQVSPARGINPFTAYFSTWRTGYGTNYARLKPLQEIEEVYSRYYVFFGNDWRTYDLPAGKLNGFDGRYKAPTATPYMGHGNSGDLADGLTGYSARGSYDCGGPANDPLAGLTGVGASGDYNVDVTLVSGSYGAQIWYSNQYLNTLRQGEWNCIENHFKLNTVTRPGMVPRVLASITNTGTVATATLAVPMTPADPHYPYYAPGETWSIGGCNPTLASWGYNDAKVITNIISDTQFQFTVPAGLESPASPRAGDGMVACPGRGNNDAMLGLWINGRFVGSRNTLRYRNSDHRPDGGIFGIDHVWYMIYAGGDAIITATSTAYMSNFVVANSYIGPLVQTAVDTVPKWLADKGNPLMTWLHVNSPANGTTMTYPDYDFAAQIESGLSGPTGQDIGWGNPTTGIMWADSGGTYNDSNSSIIMYGGGGAGGWGGNDVRGLCLEDDAPRWRTLKKPSFSSDIYSRTTPGQVPHHVTISGLSPEPGHSYQQDWVVPEQNKFYRIGFRQSWEVDSAHDTVNNIDYSMRLAAGTLATDARDAWDADGVHPNIPNYYYTGWDNTAQAQHPYTHNIYTLASYSPRLQMYDWAANGGNGAWTVSTNLVSVGSDSLRTSPAIDPRGGGMMLAIGGAAAPSNTLWMFDLTPGANFGKAVLGSLSGPYAAEIVNPGPWWAAGLVFDLVNNFFIFCKDDGYLYTLTQVGTTTEFVADRMVLAAGDGPMPIGTTARMNVPRPDLHASNNYIDLKHRMAYMPNLKGVSIYGSPWVDAYFVRTA